VASPNDPSVLVASFSVMASGATYVPMSSTYSTVEMESALERFDCSAFIYHDTLRPAVESFRSRFGDRVNFFRIEAGTDVAAGADEMLPATATDEPFDLLRGEAASPGGLEFPLPTDIGWLGLTGGTTGLPKGVEISWRALNAFVAKYTGDFPTRQPRILAAAPLTHGAGMVAMTGFARGGTVVVTKGLNPPEFLSLITAERITETSLPPTAIYKLLDHPGVREYDYSSLTNMIYGAAPMSVRRLREAIETFGPVLTEMYGQTECHTMISVLHPRDHFVDGDVRGGVATRELRVAESRHGRGDPRRRGRSTTRWNGGRDLRRERLEHVRLLPQHGRNRKDVAGRFRPHR
jgi:acyl-CoA synthetase (AMP-forming)/AMP-acid ligase II